jgi:hypothetical protein
MSIFLENAKVNTIDYSKYETDVDNVFVYGCQLVQESQLNEHNFLKSLYMADALGILESADPEVLSEGVSEVLGKIKAMFIALGEKIKKLVGAIMAKIASLGNDEKFISNYGKKFMAKWAEVKNGFKFKGYEFTVDLTADLKDYTKQELADILLQEYKTDPVFKSTIGKILDGDIPDQADLTAMKTKLQDMDNKEEADGTRAGAFMAVGDLTTLSISSESEMTEKEFRENLFKVFRNDETSKVDLEKTDIDKFITKMYAQLKDSGKIKGKIKSYSDKMLSSVDKAVRIIEKLQNQLLKFKSLKEKPIDDGKVSVESDSVYVITYTFRRLKSLREGLVTVFAAWTQAFIDQNRQAKAIMAKVIAGGKATQQESTSYEGTLSSGLFDFKIV